MDLYTLSKTFKRHASTSKGCSFEPEYLVRAADAIDQTLSAVNVACNLLDRDARYYEKRVYHPTREMRRYAAKPPGMEAVLDDYYRRARHSIELSELLINGPRGAIDECVRMRLADLWQAARGAVQGKEVSQ